MEQLRGVTPEFIKELKNQLPHGAIKVIAERTSYSPAYLSLFFTGSRRVTLKNKAIIVEAKRIINEINETTL